MNLLHRLLLLFGLYHLLRRPKRKPKPWSDAFTRVVALHIDDATPGGVFGTRDFETPWGDDDEPPRMRGLHEKGRRAF